MLEIRVLLSYFVLKFDFEVDQKILEDPHVTYSLYSFYRLKMKITKVYE